ncbi:PEP-CTERM sorting domain-containing protein [Cellvibrio sp. pealriver]|uniref:PEP-CTERM sorting domain-containing protein n=1 Tax=Cellvibrio sp. pealriver TaxID=1622269 RepID=UPI00066FF1F8|nr:PEP-CTERM sorting domain-containing protein [Cellvibrio sp. pealriver]
MKFFFAGACATLLALAAQFSHAGIIDTSNNSFIDTDTGLEWMDFGINNNLSYDQVVDELSTTWIGWSLATEAQVLNLWHNAFSGKGSDFDAEYVSGNYYARYDDDVTYPTYQSVHETTFDSMGCNILNSSYCFSRGFFADSTGSLSYVNFMNFNTSGDYVDVYGRNVNLDSYRNNPDILYSTMLVKALPASVPEANSVMLFALGLLGLNLARRRQ